MRKHNLRGRLAAILCSVVAVLGLTTTATPAQAADNVIVPFTDNGFGSIPWTKFEVRFDNTNCDAYTNVNCVSPNGAEVIYVDVKSPAGTTLPSGLTMARNKWGGSACYTSPPVTKSFTHVFAPNHKRWVATAGWTDISQLYARVQYSASEVAAVYSINPFSFAQDNQLPSC